MSVAPVSTVCYTSSDNYPTEAAKTDAAHPFPLEEAARLLADRIERYEFDDVFAVRAVSQEAGRMRAVAELARANGLTHAGAVVAERMMTDTRSLVVMLTGEGIDDRSGR
jgi:hypothetical protein